MGTVQRVIRIFPHGWSGNSVFELNSLLSEGWKVKIVVTANHSEKGDIISDYILEKEI